MLYQDCCCHLPQAAIPHRSVEIPEAVCCVTQLKEMQSSVLGTALPEPRCWQMLNLISGSLVLCFGRGLSFLLQLTIATNLSPAVMHFRVTKPSLHQLFGITSFRHCLWCGMSEGRVGSFRCWVVFLTTFNTQNSTEEPFTSWVFVKVFDLCPWYPHFWNLLFLLILYFSYWIYETSEECWCFGFNMRSWHTFLQNR